MGAWLPAAAQPVAEAKQLPSMKAEERCCERISVVAVDGESELAPG